MVTAPGLGGNTTLSSRRKLPVGVSKQVVACTEVTKEELAEFERQLYADSFIKSA